MVDKDLSPLSTFFESKTFGLIAQKKRLVAINQLELLTYCMYVVILLIKWNNWPKAFLPLSFKNMKQALQIINNGHHIILLYKNYIIFELVFEI